MVSLPKTLWATAREDLTPSFLACFIRDAKKKYFKEAYAKYRASGGCTFMKGGVEADF